MHSICCGICLLACFTNIVQFCIWLAAMSHKTMAHSLQHISSSVPLCQEGNSSKYTVCINTNTRFCIYGISSEFHFFPSTNLHTACSSFLSMVLILTVFISKLKRSNEKKACARNLRLHKKDDINACEKN